MKRAVKIIFLLAILAVPVVIFLFLKTFGENKYAVPVYHHEGVLADFPECDFNEGAFTVPLNNKNNQKANITVFFKETDNFSSQDLFNNFNRLKATFTQDVSFNAFGKTAAKNDNVVASDADDLRRRMRCHFATDTMNQFVLHDQKGYIRGYYGTELDEVDRLIVEIKIILENEQLVSK